MATAKSKKKNVAKKRKVARNRDLVFPEPGAKIGVFADDPKTHPKGGFARYYPSHTEYVEARKKTPMELAIEIFAEETVSSLYCHCERNRESIIDAVERGFRAGVSWADYTRKKKRR